MPEFRPLLNPKAPIFLLGEAPGEQEERKGIPFVGASGYELDTILEEAGLSRGDCSISNVFFERPPNNDLNSWAVGRKEAGALVDPARAYVAIGCKKGVVDPRRVQAALARLAGELARVQPVVVVALGNTALAALTGLSGIGKLRGTVLPVTTLEMPAALKVLPTYHPAWVLRNYEGRPTVVADFLKVKHESTFREIRLKTRTLHLRPTLEDLVAWTDRLLGADSLAFDIETKAKQITCIGFSPNELESYVVPFWVGAGGPHYWPSLREECYAWRAVKLLLESAMPKIAQNGIYDCSYLAEYGIVVKNFLHDTMLMHHSLYPHLPKGLDYLGSLYCNERAWKRWRVRGGDTQELKRDE